MEIATLLLFVAGSFVGGIGIGVAIWSVIDTRKRYYDQFLKEGRRNGND